MEAILRQHDEFGDDADSNEVTKTVADVVVNSLIIHIPLIIISTTAVIVTFTRIKMLHTPDNIPILALSIADLFLGILFTPITLYRHYHPLETALDCLLSIPVRYFLCELIMSMAAILAAERAISIGMPFMYVEIVTIKRIILCIFVLVLFDICIFIVGCDYFLISNQDNKTGGYFCSLTYIPIWFSIITKSISALKLFGTVFCTLYVVLKARRSLKSINKIFVEVYHVPRNQHDHHIVKLRKSSKSLLSLTCVFLGAFLPTLVLPLIFKYAQPPANTRDILLGISVHFLLINATIDTLVYAVSRKTYRIALKFFITNPPWKWHQLKANIRILTRGSFSHYSQTKTVQGRSVRGSLEIFEKNQISGEYQPKSEIVETKSKISETSFTTPIPKESNSPITEGRKESDKKQKRVTIVDWNND